MGSVYRDDEETEGSKRMKKIKIIGTIRLTNGSTEKLTKITYKEGGAICLIKSMYASCYTGEYHSKIKKYFFPYSSIESIEYGS